MAPSDPMVIEALLPAVSETTTSSRAANEWIIFLGQPVDDEIVNPAHRGASAPGVRSTREKGIPPYITPPGGSIYAGR